MATETWTTPSAWTSAFTAGDCNQTFTKAYSLLSSTAINNGTTGSIFCDFSLVATAASNITANDYIGVYVYPRNEDDTSYGDGIFTAGTPSADLPSATYWVGNIIFPKATTALKGTLTRIILPPGYFSFLITAPASQNISAANSSTQYQYRTYNRAIA